MDKSSSVLASTQFGSLSSAAIHTDMSSPSLVPIRIWCSARGMHCYGAIHLVTTTFGQWLCSGEIMVENFFGFYMP